MKKINIFLSLAAVAGLAMTSCDTRDSLSDVLIVGQEVPTCSWEIGSTVCKAGESFSFHGKYNIPEGRTGAYCQVWYRVLRGETAAATVALAGSSLSYTKTYSATDTMRAYQPIVTLSHELAQWTNHMYEIDGQVEVSRTLAPVTWLDAENWDGDRFNSYYPESFAEEFCAEVINYLTKDSTYYGALRNVYINHPFTNEQFAAVNSKYGVKFPVIDMTKDDQGASEKSQAWYSTTEADDTKIVGYYYNSVNASGNTVVHEIGVAEGQAILDNNAKIEEAIAEINAEIAEITDQMEKGDISPEAGEARIAELRAQSEAQRQNLKNVYPVYDSAAWVFCRYNDDLGSIISTVRAEYMAAFKELLTTITFPEWIFDSTNKVYKVDFSRKYSLQSQFRVYDSEGEEGVASDVREISIN